MSIYDTTFLYGLRVLGDVTEPLPTCVVRRLSLHNLMQQGFDGYNLMGYRVRRKVEALQVRHE